MNTHTRVLVEEWSWKDGVGSFICSDYITSSKTGHRDRNTNTVPDLITGSQGTCEHALYMRSVSRQWGRMVCWGGEHGSGHSLDLEGQGESPEKGTLN